MRMVLPGCFLKPLACPSVILFGKRRKPRADKCRDPVKPGSRNPKT